MKIQAQNTHLKLNKRRRRNYASQNKNKNFQTEAELMKPNQILEEGNLFQLCFLIRRIFQNSDISSKQNKASDKGNI